MPNLLNTLVSSANSMRAFERALLVSQNNVSNVETPGYAAQRLSLQALAFDPDLGLIGGVGMGDLVSARDRYTELAVRRQVESFGLFDQAVRSLEALESVFAITTGSGIPGALDKLYASFSAWSLTPNSAGARQGVIESARQVAESFNQAAVSLANVSSDAERQLAATVAQVNEIGERLAAYNGERRRGGLDDAGLDTKIHVALEELAELVGFDALYQPDGSITVLLGGQTPMVIGETFDRLGVSYFQPAAPPPVYAGAPLPAHIMMPDGADITGLITQGRLGGLLEFRNATIPSLRGDGYQAGGLNVLAKGLADRINTILTSGYISDGPPPGPGLPLFTYDAASDTRAAQTLAVNASLNAGDLAAIDPGPPYASNGIALRLAALANPLDPIDTINGFSFTEYYGNLAADVGRALSEARNNQEFKSQTAAQARYLRQELSGVSLDEEAIRLVEFQRAYEATAKFVSILDDLTEIAVNLL
jgi:flagellar hook-associated protein 1 FlgK